MQLFMFSRFEKKDHVPEAMKQLHTNDQETDKKVYTSSEVHWGDTVQCIFLSLRSVGQLLLQLAHSL